VLFNLGDTRSYAASAENLTAEPGNGGKANNGRKGSPCIWPFVKGTTHTLLDVEGQGIVRHIWCTIPPSNISAMRNLIIRIYWDHQENPSVEVPLGDFFGVAHGRQRSIVSECVSMQSAKGFNCWIQMPFKKHARITIENDSDQDVDMFFYQVDFTLGDRLEEAIGYFHAQFRRMNPCPINEDFVILDGVKGQGVYLGTVVGVRSLFKEAWFGEGEVKFFIDSDKQYPTICGTGLEDYIGSAWGLEEVITPTQGAPLVDNEIGLYSMYRFHVKDPIYFHNSLRVTLQQIGFGSKEAAIKKYGEQVVLYPAAGATKENCYFERSDDISTVAYWYQSLPTQTYPKLPDRNERIADLLIDHTQQPTRTDI
jgi:hypothetical protein